MPSECFAHEYLQLSHKPPNTFLISSNPRGSAENKWKTIKHILTQLPGIMLSSSIPLLTSSRSRIDWLWIALHNQYSNPFLFVCQWKGTQIVL